MNSRRFWLLNPILLTVVIVSLAVWVYEVGVSFFVSQYLNFPATHYDFFPLNIRNDLLGIVAFVIWIISLFLWLALFNPIKARKKMGL